MGRRPHIRFVPTLADAAEPRELLPAALALGPCERPELRLAFGAGLFWGNALGYAPELFLICLRGPRLYTADIVTALGTLRGPTRRTAFRGDVTTKPRCLPGPISADVWSPGAGLSASL